jgi:uncharacterized membrane protein YgdD (TMEM256/DUF423 family)
MTTSLFIVLAGLMGAAGVALAAAAAHGTPGAGLDGAAYMLLFHAAAMVGVVAVTGQGLAWRPLAVLALAGFVLGNALFAGDLAMRAYAGQRLFPMAAPTGGMIMIAAWVALSVAALVAWVRG